MKKEHILVIRFSALGDVVMAVPVVYSLAKTYPDVRITVLSRAYARTFFEDLAPNINFMEADLRGEYSGVRGLNKLYRRLTAKNFTAVADLHNVLRSDYLRMRFNMSRYNVAHIDKHRKARKMLTAEENKAMEQLPTSFENYADVFGRLGYPIKDMSFKSIFPPEGGNLNLLPAIIGPKKTFEQWIGFAPFAAHNGKIYPPEKMLEVIKMTKAEYPQARIFLFGRGKREDALFPKWFGETSDCINVGEHMETMQQELILMSHLDAMVSMDSANMHLASITGTPVVSVWGATHPYAGFMGWKQDTANAVQEDMPCRPCSVYGNKPCMRGDFACMNNIAPRRIFDRIKAVVG